MKTKLLMLLAAVLLTVGATNVYAHERSGDKANEGTVTLNIKLHQIQTLVVNPNQNIVDLHYTTKEHYKEGVSSEVLKDHLTVYSTGGFVINAKASDTDLKGLEGNSSAIPTADILITPTHGSNNPLEDATLTPKNLSGTTDVLLVSSTKGGVDKNFNIQYATVHKEDAYINKYVKGEDPTVYTTTVTYTINPK